MFCENCGNRLNAHLTFCEHCRTDNPQVGKAAYESGHNQSSPSSYGSGYNQGSPPSHGGGYNQGSPPSHGSGYNQGNPPPYGSVYNQNNPPSYGDGYNQVSHPAPGGLAPPVGNAGQHNAPNQPMYCTHCRYQLVGNSPICTYCGTNNFQGNAAQGYQTGYNMGGPHMQNPMGQNTHCPHCHYRLVAGMVFCGGCGRNVGVQQGPGSDISKEVLSNGITDIVLGAIDIIVALWLSSHIQGLGRTQGMPGIIANGTYSWWLIILGAGSIGAGITCLIYHKSPDKYGIVFVEYIVYSVLTVIFTFVVGIPLANFLGGAVWLIVILPIPYIAFAVKLGMHKGRGRL